MRSAVEIAAFIARQPEMVRPADRGSAGAPDCWIGAGFVRDPIWDALHDERWDCRLLNDVDVVFSDRADAGAARDRAVEAILVARARRAVVGEEPAACMCERRAALCRHRRCRRWPETRRRSRRAGRTVPSNSSPHGVDDLAGLIVRPTPAFMTRRDDRAPCRGEELARSLAETQIYRCLA